MWLLLIICLLAKASASQITGYGDKTAVYGGEAHYSCSLDNPAGVQQVTWQRHHGNESIENLATYSRRFGEQVNEPYRGRIVFTEASLSSSSITLRNVTWDDESCIICSFNVFPGGSKRTQTCLKVQGISKVDTTSHILNSGPDNEDKEVVFTCSATGKPAPTITWHVSNEDTLLNKSQMTTERNGDNTITTSSSTTVRVRPPWSGHVDCHINSGLLGQRRERIPFSLGNEEKEGARSSGPGIAVAVTILVLISCLVVAVVLHQKRLTKRDQCCVMRS
ncbi:OX-2 membrane glycoprotein-like [Pholidichthys leucotaenia]